VAESDLTERLILQLRDDVTKGFSAMARATDLARVEGQLQAYQSETDRRLEKLETLELHRSGGTNRLKVIGTLVAFAASNGALWAAVFVVHH
jgi:hypothetical protein